MIGTNAKATAQFYAVWSDGYMVFYRKQGDIAVYNRDRQTGHFEINRRIQRCAFFAGKCPP